MRELRFLLRVTLIAAVLILGKVIVHQLGWEVISLNALFTGLIAANVFIMGFLLSGVLTDYKEAEKLPSEISASLEIMAQDIRGTGIANPDAKVGPALNRIAQLSQDIKSWFYKQIDTTALLASVDDLTDQCEMLERDTAAPNLERIKSETASLRRTMVRIETIRETGFVSEGYVLAYVITFLLCVGLDAVYMDHYYESVIFSGAIGYLMIFLLVLIKDLDNPFGYYQKYTGADVSLAPLEKTIARLQRLVEPKMLVAGAPKTGISIELDPAAAEKLRAALDAAFPSSGTQAAG